MIVALTDLRRLAAASWWGRICSAPIMACNSTAKAPVCTIPTGLCSVRRMFDPIRLKSVIGLFGYGWATGKRPIRP